MLPQFPSNTRQLIEEMIEQDGRPVTFYVIEDNLPCPDCSLDPVSNTSTDSFCPTCSGEYWLSIYSGWEVQAHVTWGVLDNKSWPTGGMIDNGECTVKFMHTASGEMIANTASHVVVDNREMDIQPGIILRGVPEINRIIVKLKEKERL